MKKLSAAQVSRPAHFPGYFLLVILFLLSGAAWFTWMMLGTLGLEDGWEYEVYARDLDEVSALALDDSGGFYVTLEKRHGQGRLIHLTRGKVVELLDGMNKPDGLLRRGTRLYITNESGKYGLFEFNQGELRPMDGVHAAEGIAAAGVGYLLVIEDRKDNGRLLRVNEQTGEVEVLLSGLNEAEGVCQDSAGDIYFVEKPSNHLSRYRNGVVSIIVEGLVKPALLNCMADGSILITEDRTNFGRLLRYKNGVVKTMVTRLHSPQSVILGHDGSLYLAEQRRKRILRIYQPRP